MRSRANVVEVELVASHGIAAEPRAIPALAAVSQLLRPRLRPKPLTAKKAWLPIPCPRDSQSTTSTKVREKPVRERCPRLSKPTGDRTRCRPEKAEFLPILLRAINGEKDYVHPFPIARP